MVPRMFDQGRHGAQLVISGEDRGASFLARRVLLPLDGEEPLDDVQQRVLGPDLLPQVGCAVAGRMVGVAGAAVPAPIEGEEARVLASERRRLPRSGPSVSRRNLRETFLPIRPAFRDRSPASPSTPAATRCAALSPSRRSSGPPTGPSRRAGSRAAVRTAPTSATHALRAAAWRTTSRWPKSIAAYGIEIREQKVNIARNRRVRTTAAPSACCRRPIECTGRRRRAIRDGAARRAGQPSRRARPRGGTGKPRRPPGSWRR